MPQDIISDDERLLELLEDLSPTVQDRDRLVAVVVGLRACVNGRDRDGVNAVYTVAQTVAPEDAVERLFGLSQSDWGRMDTLIDTRIQEILSERRVLPPQVDVDQGTAQSFSSLSSQGASNGGTTGREAASTGAVVVRRRNENDEDATTARTEPTTETQM